MQVKVGKRFYQNLECCLCSLSIVTKARYYYNMKCKAIIQKFTNKTELDYKEHIYSAVIAFRRVHKHVLDPVHAKSASREAAPAFLWVKDKVHESAEHGFFVAVFSEEIVGTPEQVLQLMDFGE